MFLLAPRLLVSPPLPRPTAFFYLCRRSVVIDRSVRFVWHARLIGSAWLAWSICLVSSVNQYPITTTKRDGNGRMCKMRMLVPVAILAFLGTWAYVVVNFLFHSVAVWWTTLSSFNCYAKINWYTVFFLVRYACLDIEVIDLDHI